MKILSWNVNGLRAVIKKGFLDFLKKQKPDILCLQEIKISASALANKKLIFPGYQEFWHPAKRPGYSGTAILVKNNFKTKIKSYASGIGIKQFDQEGRVQTLKLDKFCLVNAYFPNAGPELARLNYKIKFNQAMLKYLKKLERKKPILLTGDFNVAHTEIDLARPKQNIGNAGFTTEERQWFDKFLKIGYIDVFRHFYPNKIKYTWWTYRFGARARNIGWRIDYFLSSPRLIKNIKKVFILNNVQGSDHCPVGVEIKIDL